LDFDTVLEADGPAEAADALTGALLPPAAAFFASSSFCFFKTARFHASRSWSLNAVPLGTRDLLWSYQIQAPTTPAAKPQDMIDSALDLSRNARNHLDIPHHYSGEFNSAPQVRRPLMAEFTQENERSALEVFGHRLCDKGCKF
jgi:hypothetical protein